MSQSRWFPTGSRENFAYSVEPNWLIQPSALIFPGQRFSCFTLTSGSVGYQRPNSGLPSAGGRLIARPHPAVVPHRNQGVHFEGSIVELKPYSIPIDRLQTLKTLIFKRDSRVPNWIKKHTKGSAAQRISAD